MSTPATDGERAESFQTECVAARVALHSQDFIDRLRLLLAQVRNSQAARDAELAGTAGSGISAAKLIRERGMRAAG